MFLNAVMLAGLGGAVIPLVLHLLARARYRDVPWGAMMFLAGREARQSRTARLRQWALLAVRMALVALIAMALARPVVRHNLSGVAPAGRLTAVIMLDCSYSMAYEELGRSRFEKARDAALQVLAGLRKGDEVALVLLGEQVEVTKPSGDFQTVARDLAEARVSGASADIAAGLEQAKRILNQPERLNRELYLLCDRQAVSWRSIGPVMDAAWLADPTAATRFYVIPVGGETTRNVAVEGVELVDSVAVRGQPADVEVRLRNYGDEPRVGLELSLWMQRPGEGPRRFGELGGKSKTISATVPPRGTAAVRVPVTFDQVGSHVLSARVRDDGLAADDRFDTAIDVIDPIEVLIVSGDEGQSPVRRESFFAQLALSPYQSAQKRPGDSIVVTVRSADAWAATPLDKYRVVILANVPEVTADQARMLEQKVYEGGGLVVCPGNLLRLENCNSVLYRNGLGLLPARLESPTAADGSEATTLLGLELSHPIFRFQRGGDPLPEAAIGRYFPAIPRAVDSRVLGTYASGRPFLIEGPRGRGRVLLVTTPLDADWGRLPLDPFYLPFVQSMVRYASAPSLPSRNIQPGDALVASFDQPLQSAELWLNDQKLALPSVAGRGQLVFRTPQRQGIYRLQATLKEGGDRVLHFVTQASRIESDPASLSEAQWEEYERLLHFSRIDLGRQVPGAVAASDRGGKEAWLPLVALAVALGAGEVWLVRRWHREAA